MRCPGERNPAEGGAWVRGRSRPHVSAGRDVSAEARSSCPACRRSRLPRRAGGNARVRSPGPPAPSPASSFALRHAHAGESAIAPRRMSCRRSTRFLRRRLRTRGRGRRRRPPDAAWLTGVSGNAQCPGFSARRSSPRRRVGFFGHVLLLLFRRELPGQKLDRFDSTHRYQDRRDAGCGPRFAVG